MGIGSLALGGGTANTAQSLPVVADVQPVKRTPQQIRPHKRNHCKYRRYSRVLPHRRMQAEQGQDNGLCRYCDAVANSDVRHGFDCAGTRSQAARTAETWTP